MKKRKLILVLCLALVLITATFTSLTLARYRAEYADDPQALSPASLFFETDLAAGETYFVAAGSDFNFTVRNHDNLSHVTPAALQFEVAVNGTAVGTYSCAANTKENKSISIPAAHFGAVGATKQVTLKSTAPYEKTITFNVQVVSAGAVNCYSVTDKGDYVQLDLYVGSTLPTADITVNYAGLAPDSTGDLTAMWTADAGTGTIPTSSLLPHAHYTLYFFGTKAVTEQTNAALGATVTLG